MPFVPLGSRKRYEVILDDDKEAILAKQRARDNAVISCHIGEKPSASGYRFGNHPATMGRVRGPDVPFQDATPLWSPPEEEPSGPASRRAADQGKCGAYLEGSHKLRTSTSCPSLRKFAPTSTLSAMQEVADPLVVERKRWEKMAAFSASQELKDYKPREPVPLQPRQKKELVKTGGLVNFPKYMLIENCHLKRMDQARFCDAENAKRAEAETRLTAERAARAAAAADSASSSIPPSPSGENTLLEASSFSGPPPSLRMTARHLPPEDANASSKVVWQKASMGAPTLKLDGQHWGGSAMPAGGGSRTSNPFRMG